MLKEFRQILSLYARWFGTGERALLLPVQTLVTARHLLPLARLAAGEGIPVRFVLSPKLRDPSDRALVRAWFSPHATEVDDRIAHLRRWTLVVVADHGHFHSLLPGGSPVVHIGHGSPSKLGGRVPGLPWEYGQAPRRRGHVRYDEMIEASERIREALEAIDPTLRGRIRVLGRLLDDEMLQAAADRDAVRATLGLGGDRPVLAVASSIGTQSLFARHFDALVAQLEALRDRYEALLCPHPNEYRRWHARMPPGTGLRIPPIEVATETVLAASDLFLCDYGSLCHKAALMDVPMVLAQCDPLPVWPLGATAQLQATWPCWDGAAPLAGLLDRAMAARGRPAAQACKDWVNSRPGQAHALYREWLHARFR